ncbi:hypothetical protein EVAR_11185_1 [Eumeta japonica]|uniref:Uncharacterized protein n=1 Tax=Eumeta variegata TaxID=151549 RepID=A0A4C1U5A0_EUMVA|nr:hypothetical protein EVAR_11185_1 [Eumeta japonica]
MNTSALTLYRLNVVGAFGGAAAAGLGEVHGVAFDYKHFCKKSRAEGGGRRAVAPRSAFPIIIFVKFRSFHYGVACRAPRCAPALSRKLISSGVLFLLSGNWCGGIVRPPARRPPATPALLINESSNKVNMKRVGAARTSLASASDSARRPRVGDRAVTFLEVPGGPRGARVGTRDDKCWRRAAHVTAPDRVSNGAIFLSFLHVVPFGRKLRVDP